MLPETRPPPSPSSLHEISSQLRSSRLFVRPARTAANARRDKLVSLCFGNGIAACKLHPLTVLFRPPERLKARATLQRKFARFAFQIASPFERSISFSILERGFRQSLRKRSVDVSKFSFRSLIILRGKLKI